MAVEIDTNLGAFHADDYTVRLVGGICKVVPFAPELTHYASLAEAIKQVDPNAKKDVLDRALALARGDDAQKALWMVDAMDKADTGISVFSGIASAVKLYQSKQGERLQAIETDPQQAADAVLKGLALAYVVHQLYPGGPAEKVAAFRASKAGQALAFYYASVEVGLPFADNALVGGGTFLKSLYDRLQGEQVQKLAAVAGPDAAKGAESVMGQLVGPLDGLVQMASGHLTAIATAATTHLPTALDVGDKAAGVLATAADAMPVYRYLGTRLVAEAIVARALAESGRTADTIAHAAKNPALDEIKYTTKKPGKDEIVVPQQPARRGFCLFFVALFVAGVGSLGAGALALLVDVVR